MLTDAQRAELSETLFNALIRGLKNETIEDRALIDNVDLPRLISTLLELNY